MYLAEALRSVVMLPYESSRLVQQGQSAIKVVASLLSGAASGSASGGTSASRAGSGSLGVYEEKLANSALLMMSELACVTDPLPHTLILRSGAMDSLLAIVRQGRWAWPTPTREQPSPHPLEFYALLAINNFADHREGVWYVQ